MLASRTTPSALALDPGTVLDVYFTIDVEVWCDGWHDIDARFASAFARYIHGPGGEHGLPYQLRVLNEHGLSAVCFVEPLFATRFGAAPLAEIVGLIERSGHETQLHMHTEWVDEAREPLLPGIRGKRQHLRQFDREEQTRLIAIGIDLLMRAGAARPAAFRAGSFAFNGDSLPALAANGVDIDASYNASMMGPDSGVCPGELLLEPRMLGGVLEVPMTVYRDGSGRLRHTQLTACSFGELSALLWQALEAGTPAFVILSHNFELLTPGQKRVDPVVLERFRRLCGFLDRHRDVFRVRGFRDGPPPALRQDARLLRSPPWRTGLRMMEQLGRRRFA